MKNDTCGEDETGAAAAASCTFDWGVGGATGLVLSRTLAGRP
jgi:hypothetical protein